MVGEGDVEITVRDGIAEVMLARGKVNALNEPMVLKLGAAFGRLAGDGAVHAVVLTGRGKFFSFGFDIPEFMSYSQEAFTAFLEEFTGLYRTLFTFPKPLVAALNGHTIAGGCMLALACDRRLMVAEGAKISLNEVTFGATVFAGATEILKFVAGGRAAERVLYQGALHAPAEALALGLVDRVADPLELARAAREEAAALAGNDLVAYASLKRLVRAPVVEALDAREAASVREFVQIWYSPTTRAKLAKIEIR